MEIISLRVVFCLGLAVTITHCIVATPLDPKPNCTDVKKDIVFIIDSSSSVTAPNFELEKNFLKDIISNLDLDSGNVRVGAIIYSTSSHVQFQLKDFSTTEAVNSAIDAIPYCPGNTNTASALRAVRTSMFTEENGDRPDVDNMAVLLNDGVSNINHRLTIPEAYRARAAGIHVYAVGVNVTDLKELKAIASKPVPENILELKDFTELGGINDTIISAVCSKSAGLNRIPEPETAVKKFNNRRKGCRDTAFYRCPVRLVRKRPRNRYPKERRNYSSSERRRRLNIRLRHGSRQA